MIPAPVPEVTPETEPYWAGTTRGALVLPRCRACATVIWYPRAFCPACHHADVEWFEASGLGTVYSHTTNSRGEGDYRGAGPYVLAYVELDEGPRVLTNVDTDDPAALTVGARVRVRFDPTGAGPALMRFVPVT